MLLAIDVRHIHHTTSFPHALTDNSPLSSTALGAGASRCLHLLTHVPVSRIKDIIFYSPPARLNVHRTTASLLRQRLSRKSTPPSQHHSSNVPSQRVSLFSSPLLSSFLFCSLLCSTRLLSLHGISPVRALHNTTEPLFSASLTRPPPPSQLRPPQPHGPHTARPPKHSTQLSLRTLFSHTCIHTHTHNQRPTSSSCTLHHVHITPCVRRIAPTLTHHINHATTVSIPHTHQPTYHHAPHFSIPFPTPFPSTSCDHRSSSVLSLSLSLSQRAILTTTSNTTPLAITQYA
mmetsp:Transcript_2770/g.7599  ORF Transcript_2770/g.7599 Transcript_2770/m.7599 type:complete len:289 (+) Transcript_2770:2127-2993(+)